MNSINRIITEEINKTVLNNYQKKILKLLGDLNKIDFSSCGNEVTEYAQDLNNLGYNVIECIRNGNISQQDNNSNGSRIVGRSRRGMYINPNGFSNFLRNYGFKVPNEGLTNNVVRNSMNWYNKTQDIWGNKGNEQQRQKKLNNNIQVLQGDLKQIMDSYWPQLFTRYANIVGRYRAVLQKIPTLTMLTQTMEQLYNAIK